MAVAVTDDDAAAIVTALATVGHANPCMHLLAQGETSHNPPSIFCESPAVALAAGRPRCMKHIAAMAGATVVPVDHHPSMGAAVRRLLVAWELPSGASRDAWVTRCVRDLAAMRLGFVSQIRDDEMPNPGVAQAAEIERLRRIIGDVAANLDGVHAEDCARSANEHASCDCIVGREREALTKSVPQ